MFELLTIEGARMQTIYHYTDVQMIPKKQLSNKPLRLTSRDLSILEYLLSMKFGSVEDIHRKFFKHTRDGEMSNCLRWTRERLAQLIDLKMIQAIKDVVPKTLYLTTPRGYLYLRNLVPLKEFCRASPTVDIKTYDHDSKVILLRHIIEESKKGHGWISDKELSEFEQYTTSFSADTRPDAIYNSFDGKTIAFELELTRKSKDRIKSKIRNYSEIILSSVTNPRPFDLVHYVCSDDKLKALIQSEASLLSQYFKITTINDYVTKTEAICGK